MEKAIEKLKSVGYASLGVHLLVADGIAKRKVGTPDFIEKHAPQAREEATKALTGLRSFSSPHASKLNDKLPSGVAGKMAKGCNKAWDFMGIAAPDSEAEKGEESKGGEAAAIEAGGDEGADGEGETEGGGEDESEDNGEGEDAEANG